MNESEIITLIQTEIEKKDWGFTEQFLEIHSPVYINNIVKIENIITANNEVTVYLPIVGERFYLTFYIDLIKKEIFGISTEPYISIYFRATSENLSSDELRKNTKLAITESWNKGDIRKNGKGIYSFSSVIIDINKTPDSFEAKLNALISELENDRDGIKKLAELADGYIQVLMEFHNGNGLIGGPNLSKEIIQKLSEMDLSVDFDLAVSGNKFIS
ncbi:DUF4279 domain-containing protein [Chryseobacterium sp. KACC 21268]|nr:DUF4279 domain-containing protein [Chryseobacterium sp. KACC 21268]